MIAELPAAVGDAPNHGSDFGFQHLHGEGDLADFVLAAGVDQLADRIVADPPGLLRQA